LGVQQIGETDMGERIMRVAEQCLDVGRAGGGNMAADQRESGKFDQSLRMIRLVSQQRQIGGFRVFIAALGRAPAGPVERAVECYT
jgi:hypothetical protein